VRQQVAHIVSQTKLFTTPWRWRARRASGSRSDGTSGEEIVMDAAGFCRLVSGRPGPDGGQLWWLLATQIPF
jgi:hypothetical protein